MVMSHWIFVTVQIYRKKESKIKIKDFLSTLLIRIWANSHFNVLDNSRDKGLLFMQFLYWQLSYFGKLSTGPERAQWVEGWAVCLVLNISTERPPWAEPKRKWMEKSHCLDWDELRNFRCLISRFLHSLSATPKSLRQPQDRRSVEIFNTLSLSILRLRSGWQAFRKHHTSLATSFFLHPVHQNGN